MKIPIINPSTLTEKQRDIIKAEYHRATSDCLSNLYNVHYYENYQRMELLKWLFGEEFFNEKGE